LKFKDEKGSVVIEAVISVSLFMTIAVMVFGLLISVYLDESLQWATLQMREELSFYTMPFMGHDRIVQQEVNLLTISGIASLNLKKQIEINGLKSLVELTNKTNLSFDEYGNVEYTIHYKYKMPTVFPDNEIVIPICAAVISDGIDYSEGMVYITTYGEKFHKGDCFHLRKSKFGILLGKAKEKGYEACKNCFGKDPQLD